MAGSAYAENLGPNDKFVVYEDWSGGLNTRSRGSSLKNQTPNAENGLIDEVPGAIVKRKGMTVAGRNPYLSKINFQFEFVDDGGTHWLFQSDSSRVTATSDLANYTVIKNTLTVSAQLYAAQGRGFALFTNGADPVFISSGVMGIPLDGNNGRANVPRGKYVAFNLERFFLYKTTASGSDLYWSSVKSTDGFTYALTSPFSWPPINSRFVGENDGAVGSGLDAYRGQLLMHKANKSIYTLFGNTDSSFLPRKTNAHSGAGSQESVAQSDNLEYYYEKGGIYAFDGSDSVRISDDIFPDIQSISSNLTNIQSNVWDTKNDFDTSYSSYINVVSNADGTLTLDQSSVALNEIGPVTPNATAYVPVPANTAYPFAVLNPTTSLKNGWEYRIQGVVLWMRPTGGGSPTTNTPRITVKNLRTGKTASAGGFSKSWSGSFEQVNWGEPNNSILFLDQAGYTSWTTDDLINGRFQIQVNNDNPSRGYDVYLPTQTAYGKVNILPATTGQYISNITTVATITAWDAFNANSISNGGANSFFVRTATDAVNIPSQTWMPIAPGGIIPFSSTKTVIQWASTFTAPSILNTPSLDYVSINHNEGGVSDSSPRAVEWKKRYLLMVSTLSSGQSTIIYVKSKMSNQTPNAWMKYTFTNDYFKSITKFNDNLYLGSGSTGTFYRFDYGTNDNGNAINWFYETPDTTMDNIFFKKEQYEYLIDADQTSGATLGIRTTVDGSSMTTKTVDLSGTGRLIKSIKNVPKLGKYFRYRFYNSDLDKDITFNSFAIRYMMTGVRD